MRNIFGHRCRYSTIKLLPSGIVSYMMSVVQSKNAVIMLLDSHSKAACCYTIQHLSTPSQSSETACTACSRPTPNFERRRRFPCRHLPTRRSQQMAVQSSIVCVVLLRVLAFKDSLFMVWSWTCVSVHTFVVDGGGNIGVSGGCAAGCASNGDGGVECSDHLGV